MSEKIRLDRKIGFRNTFCTKCINVIIDSIGPSIILRSIFARCVILRAFLLADSNIPGIICQNCLDPARVWIFPSQSKS